MKNIIYALLILIFAGCNSSKVPATGDLASAKVIAEEKLGDSLTYVMNANDTYVLCLNEKEATNLEPRNLISYIVIEVKSGKIVHEAKLSGGSIKWHDDTHLEQKVTSGLLKGADKSNVSTKVIDILTSNSKASSDRL